MNMTDDQKPPMCGAVRLEQYVINHYSHLLAESERRGLDLLNQARKLEGMAGMAQHGLLPPVPGYSDRKREEAADLRRKASTDPIIGPIVNRGEDYFLTAVTLRLLRDHGAEIKLNLCPRCLSLCRTPNSKQCPVCFQSWHRAS